LSGEYVDRLKRRAKAFLAAASMNVDYDLAMLFAEQAAQLYIKATYYELFGDMLRGHRLRELLSTLVKALEKHGYSELAESIISFVDSSRRDLIDLEEAYTASRYGYVDYTREDAERAAKTAQRLVDLLEEVVKHVKLG